jgi:hypothetical protein
LNAAFYIKINKNIYLKILSRFASPVGQDHLKRCKFYFVGQTRARNPSHTDQVESTGPLTGLLIIEECDMKKRWINSVIEASKTEMTVFPFQRGRRSTMRMIGLDARVRRIA